MGIGIFIKDRKVGNKPLRSILQAIQKLQPTATQKCRSFAGMVNFLSMFCPELQKLLKQIYNLNRKGRQFIWGKEQQNAFEEIKHRLVKGLLYCICPTVRVDFIYIQTQVSSPWEVLCIRYKMGNQN